MADEILAKLPEDFRVQLKNMVAAGTSATQLQEFINACITQDQANKLGFSRTDLGKYLVASRKNSPQAPRKTNKEQKPSAPTSTSLNASTSTDGKGTETTMDSSDTSGTDSSASSDDAEVVPGIDLEFASIDIPDLQEMILKKESFKALRRLVLANTRPRKAMSAAKMHLPSGLAHTDKTLESCVDQAYLAIAALDSGQTDVARILLNNMAANLELERRRAIAVALGVEDAVTDISRDGRTDLFSFEERERLPSFRDQQKSRKSQPRKTKAKPNADRSFRPSTDPKNGRKTSGGDRKDGRHQPRE